MESNPSAQNALAAVSGTRSALAERLVTPWWYHPVLGALAGAVGVLAGGVFGTWGVMLSVLPVHGMVALMATYRRMTGVDITRDPPETGPRPRRLRHVLAGSTAACLAGCLVVGLGFHIRWVPWLLAGVVVVLVTPVGRAYDRALRADLRSPIA